MADNDDRQIIQVQSNSLQSINEALRRLSEMVYALEGRTEPVVLRNDVNVDGDLSVDGRVLINLETKPLTAAGNIEAAMSSQDPARGFISRGYGTHTMGGAFVGFKARGSQLAPQAVASGDYLCLLYGRGYGGGNPFGNIGGALGFVASEDWSVNGTGANFGVFLSQNGNPGAGAVPRLLLSNNGDLSVYRDIIMLNSSGSVNFADGTSQTTAFGKYHVRLYNTSAQTLTTGVGLALDFNTESFDPAGMHNTVSNITRITVPTAEAAGKYAIGGGVAFAPSAVGWRALGIRLNGTTDIGVTLIGANPVAAAGHHQQVATIYDLASGDYVELVATQTSGGDLGTNAVTPYTPQFWAYRIGE